jgi:uncharacterized membrane protein YheB (UPF0754 family)
MRHFQKEKNSFTKIEKKIQVDNVMEFPSLSEVTTPLKNESKEKKNYVDMFLTEKNEEKKDVYLPGWLHISMDKDRKVKKVMNGKVCEELLKLNDDEKDVQSLNKKEYNKRTVKVISEMIQNWENYKTWYVNLYGVECYEKMYEMVYKDDEIVYDDEYSDEDENFTQDNTYTDEDDDDY